MYNIIFDKKNEVTITNHNIGSWPQNDNCYSVKVVFPDKKFLDINYLNKKEYHLAEKMKETLSQEQIDSLLPLIDDFGDERYTEGGDSERMSNEEY